MNFDEIKQEVEKIYSEVFMYSLKKDLSLEQLALLYSKLIGCRYSFLETSFKGFEIDEVEQLKFNLMEEIHMIQIFIKEKIGQDDTKEIEKLKHLYKKMKNKEVKNYEYKYFR